jgi:hypothetical protein
MVVNNRQEAKGAKITSTSGHGTARNLQLLRLGGNKAVKGASVLANPGRAFTTAGQLRKGVVVTGGDRITIVVDRRHIRTGYNELQARWLAIKLLLAEESDVSRALLALLKRLDSARYAID